MLHITDKICRIFVHIALCGNFNFNEKEAATTHQRLIYIYIYIYIGERLSCAFPATDIPSPFAKGLICKARDLISKCAKTATAR